MLLLCRRNDMSDVSRCVLTPQSQVRIRFGESDFSLRVRPTRQLTKRALGKACRNAPSFPPCFRVFFEPLHFVTCPESRTSHVTKPLGCDRTPEKRLRTL